MPQTALTLVEGVRPGDKPANPDSGEAFESDLDCPADPSGARHRSLLDVLADVICDSSSASGRTTLRLTAAAEVIEVEIMHRSSDSPQPSSEMVGVRPRDLRATDVDDSHHLARGFPDGTAHSSRASRQPSKVVVIRSQVESRRRADVSGVEVVMLDMVDEHPLGDWIAQVILGIARGTAAWRPRGVCLPLDRPARRRRVDEDSPIPGLTDREFEILHLMARGCNNREVSTRLHLSEKTVRNYVSSIYTKLHVADRGQAIAAARDAGLGQATTPSP